MNEGVKTPRRDGRNAGLANGDGAPQREELRAAFAAFDEDGSGRLSAEELVGVFTRPGGGKPVDEAEARAFVAKHDRNGDGELVLDEFVVAVLRPADAEATILSAALSAAAAAVRAAPIESFLEGEEYWEEFNGAALEPALRVDEALGGSPVRLVDARFLIELAERGGRLCRRQDLPEEAFVSPEALRRLPNGARGCLRIMSISHPWQQPDNPDPKGINLRLLARALRSFVKYDPRPYAVFIDFMGLHQKGPNGECSEAEAELFSRALSDMMSWYAHPMLLTLKLTQLPPDYPAGFAFPAGMTPNTAGYFERGWCFCESSVSNMCKDYDFVLDLGKLTPETEDLDALVKECAAKRDPPLPPADFRRALADKSFTSKKADEEMVAGLYEATFRRDMGAATNLMYMDLQWGDAEVIQLCRALASGVLEEVRELFLADNQIGDEGAKALAEVLDGGYLPKLTTLYLSSNQLSEAGKTAIKTAAKKRSIGCGV